MRLETDVSIVEYDSVYGDAFGRLNREWLEKFFRVEPIDELILDDPQSRVLDHGGSILYAIVDGVVVGTVALKHDGQGVFELTKMAVTEGQQGRGIGRQLLCAAIEKFAEMAGNRLYLESHSSLRPALALYESAGFRHEPPPAASEYERADVYMVYIGK